MHLEHPSFYENAFLLAPAGIAISSINGVWNRVNPALCQMLGYDEWELVGKDIKALTHPEDWPHEEQQLKELQDGRCHSSSMEARYIHKSGHVLWMSEQVSVFCNELGTPDSLYIYLTDISERKLADQLESVILEHSQDIIVYSSADGTCLYASPALQNLLGYHPNEFIGLKLLDYFHSEDVTNIVERQYSDMDKICARFRHADGQYIWFETSIKIIRNADGEVDKILSIGRDVTERMLTEQALINSQRSLAEAQRIASIGSWEWDLERDEIYCSEELFRIHGITDNKITGRFETLLHFVHPEDHALLLAMLKRAIDEGHNFSLECRLKLSDNNEKHVHIQGVVVLDEQGQSSRIQGTLQDISEQKKMQQLLEETIDRYTSLKRYNPDAIISLDKTGYIVSVNPAAEQITGYSAQELNEFHYTDLFYYEDVGRAQQWFQQFMKNESVDCGEMRIVGKDGSVIDLLITPAPIIIRHEMVGCYVMVKDITEQKRKDELLRKSEKLSVVGQLAAGVAHEIRNPLTALKGFVKLMMHSDAQFPRYLSIMKEELDRIELIVSELLMLSKPQTLQLKVTDLKDLVEEVQTLIGTQAIMKNIEIQLAAEQGPFTVHCDPNQIKQVIINFLKNAIEAMTREGIIQIVLSVDALGHARLQIIDQGCGIPEDKLPRLGEPFFTTKEGGTGLGLMVSQKIIEHHGGKMSITSRVNYGTMVEVSLPLTEHTLKEQSVMGS
ncbi:PAS domain S-box protein [Paenibacillus sp. UNC451MF]|uniref:PAS domain S-box protein n=1 Tax=Paenibacillus sp. UNC451MF TaxID=1449063 RepID=UPI001E62291C|nr:PAS domain S-box protein [Paenibacillus sp. UNC451MF]